jgi:uncharacterized LabA/DUF88 family protein
MVADELRRQADVFVELQDLQTHIERQSRGEEESGDDRYDDADSELQTV